MSRVQELKDEEDIEGIEKTLKNPFDKTYWFARMLIQSDRYGGIGTKSDLMIEGAEVINEMHSRKDKFDLNNAKKAIFDLLVESRSEGTKVRKEAKRLTVDLDPMIEEWEDLLILGLTMKHVVTPTNRMLNEIPSNDVEIAKPIAKAYLDKYDEQGLEDVIEIWDDLGMKGCISVERAQIVEGFGILREILRKKNFIKNQDEMDYVMTAFVQEFERRAGQKRKGRGGRSLEDVTGFILNYFNITDVELVPEHIRASLEVDKLVECDDGWHIAISCKRTFRERWKQSFTENMGTLDDNKIKSIWHLITYDRDLTKNKIIEMGKHRCIIYLPDNSRILNKKDKEIDKYVRPMSSFVEDIKKEVR
ncbi:MAG: hypothetical protein ACOC1V_03345 [Candidatus Saliniplasma sp.]